MKICLDLHDFSIINNRLDLLLKLKEHFPGFRVSLFTVPIDRVDTWGIYTIRNEILKDIKKHLDWLQIIPHGYLHDRHEMRYMNYHHFKNTILPNIIDALEKDGLPYERGFCAPHWSWTADIVNVLNELGWWGAVDPRQPNMIVPKEYYRYSYCIDENFPLYDGLKLHGHIYGTKNDLGRCLNNLLNLIPTDAEWCYITDFLEKTDEN